MATDSPNRLEVLRCFICFGKVEEARLCPTCSKMCCRACITRWLTERKQQCPYCRSPLQVNQLVICRFMDDIYEEIARIEKTVVAPVKTADGDVCKEHNSPLNYVCVPCNETVCSDCAMFGNKHKGHDFQRLAEIYDKHVKAIQTEITSIHGRLSQLQRLEEGIETNIRFIKVAKEERSAELQAALQEIDSRLTSQLKDKLLKLLAQKNDVLKESHLLESLLHELSGQLDVTVVPRSILIKKTNDLLAMLREIHNKPISQFYRDPVPNDFVSEIVPPYDYALFRVRDFEHVRQTQEVVYSDPLVVHGLTWRLKLYANGNGVAKGAFISVFLELSAGFPGFSAKYEYRVEMLNMQDPEKVVSRVFASRFEIGECWGYNRFFRIDMLEEEGYLGADGSLSLKFFVRSPSYFLLCKDHQRYMEHMERVNGEQQRQIELLHNKLAAIGGIGAIGAFGAGGTPASAVIRAESKESKESEAVDKAPPVPPLPTPTNASTNASVGLNSAGLAPLPLPPTPLPLSSMSSSRTNTSVPPTTTSPPPLPLVPGSLSADTAGSARAATTSPPPSTFLSPKSVGTAIPTSATHTTSVTSATASLSGTVASRPAAVPTVIPPRSAVPLQPVVSPAALAVAAARAVSASAFASTSITSVPVSLSASPLTSASLPAPTASATAPSGGLKQPLPNEKVIGAPTSSLTGNRWPQIPYSVETSTAGSVTTAPPLGSAASIGAVSAPRAALTTRSIPATSTLLAGGSRGSVSQTLPSSSNPSLAFSLSSLSTSPFPASSSRLPNLTSPNAAPWEDPLRPNAAALASSNPMSPTPSLLTSLNLPTSSVTPPRAASTKISSLLTTTPLTTPPPTRPRGAAGSVTGSPEPLSATLSSAASATSTSSLASALKSIWNQTGPTDNGAGGPSVNPTTLSGYDWSEVMRTLVAQRSSTSPSAPVVSDSLLASQQAGKIVTSLRLPASTSPHTPPSRRASGSTHSSGSEDDHEDADIDLAITELDFERMQSAGPATIIAPVLSPASSQRGQSSAPVGTGSQRSQFFSSDVSVLEDEPRPMRDSAPVDLVHEIDSEPDAGSSVVTGFISERKPAVAPGRNSSDLVEAQVQSLLKRRDSLEPGSSVEEEDGKAEGKSQRETDGVGLERRSSLSKRSKRRKQKPRKALGSPPNSVSQEAEIDADNIPAPGSLSHSGSSHESDSGM